VGELDEIAGKNCDGDRQHEYADKEPVLLQGKPARGAWGGFDISQSSLSIVCRYPIESELPLQRRKNELLLLMRAWEAWIMSSCISFHGRRKKVVRSSEA
jgi:hypothetical protein